MPRPTSVFNLEVHLSAPEEILAAVQAASPERPVSIATLNPEFVMEAQSNTAFGQALKEMTHCSIDGGGLAIWLRVASWFHRDLQIPTRYPGADLVAHLFSRYQKGEKSFYLLGGPPGLAHEAAQTIQTIYPAIRIVGTTDGGLINPAKVTISELLKSEILKTQPDIVLVGFGAPKQELWIQAARDLNIPVMIGVGGTFKFYTDHKRAPEIFRTLHLEWLYRTFTEPGHWKRAWRAVVSFSLFALGWILNLPSTHLTRD